MKIREQKIIDILNDPNMLRHPMYSLMKINKTYRLFMNVFNDNLELQRMLYLKEKELRHYKNKLILTRDRVNQLKNEIINVNKKFNYAIDNYNFINKLKLKNKLNK